jgi:hypothetical protein
MSPLDRSGEEDYDISEEDYEVTDFWNFTTNKMRYNIITLGGL